MLGLDHAGRPSDYAAFARAAVAAGYAFEFRYLCDPNARTINQTKIARKPEIDAAHAAGLATALIWQNTKQDAKGGYEAGRREGQWAAYQAATLGAPNGLPIYFAVGDYDAPASDHETIAAYLRGVGEVIGQFQIGGYGKRSVVEDMLRRGLITRVWQSYGFSRPIGEVSPLADVYQRQQQATVGGVLCDINETFRDGFGAWKGSERIMELWHPRAIKVVPANRAGGTFDVMYPWRQVGHTTEGGPNYYPSAASYYGHQNWPTSTIARVGGVAKICQHFPINRSAYALQNDPGGVDTNRARVVQFEIGWWTARIHELPEDLAALVRDWVTWVASQTGAPLTQFDSSRRMSFDEWRRFSGICGHRNVPENDHSDWPGVISLGPPPPAPIPNPNEDDMIDESCIPSWATMTPSTYTFNGKPWGNRMPFFRLLCGDVEAPYEAAIIAYPGVPLMAGLDQYPGWRYGDTFGLPTLFISGLQGKPVDIDEGPNGDIFVLAADGGSFKIAKRP